MIGYNYETFGFVAFIIILLIWNYHITTFMKEIHNDSSQIIDAGIETAEEQIQEYEFLKNYSDYERKFKNEAKLYVSTIPYYISSIKSDIVKKMDENYSTFTTDITSDEFKTNFINLFFKNILSLFNNNNIFINIDILSNELINDINKNFTFSMESETDEIFHEFVINYLNIETDYKNFETLFLSKYAEFYPDCELSKYYKRMKEAEELGILEDV